MIDMLVITECRQDVRLGLIHKFLWDRYRSVRQDLYIQGIDVRGTGCSLPTASMVLTFLFAFGAETLQDEFAVNVFEEIVRFHLLSEHDLCEEEASSES